MITVKVIIVCSEYSGRKDENYVHIVWGDGKCYPRLSDERVKMYCNVCGEHRV